MEILALKKHCIITPLSPKLDLREADKIVEAAKSFKDVLVGFDLSYVKDCTFEFIEEIKKLEYVSLFNITSDIFALLTLMNLDKKFNIYVSKNDFLENKHRILNRNLTLLN